MTTRQETRRPPLIDFTGLDLSTAEGAAAARLRATTSAGLIDAIIRLTHRIHEAPDTSWTPAPDKRELRAQRDVVRAELLRRVGA